MSQIGELAIRGIKEYIVVPHTPTVTTKENVKSEWNDGFNHSYCFHSRDSASTGKSVLGFEGFWDGLSLLNPV